MKKLIKFMIVCGLAFWLTGPSLNGEGWDSFLVVLGVLSLMLNRHPSGREPVDLMQPTSVDVEDEEEDNRRKTRLLGDGPFFDDPLYGCFKRSKGNYKDPFGDPFYRSPFEE